jgi:hypothetical protein
MPVKIGTFGPLSEEEFTTLQQRTRKTDPAMLASWLRSRPVAPFGCRSWTGRVPGVCGPPSAGPQPVEV